MHNFNWREILESIIIGAVIAFLTAFLEGLLDFLNSHENNIIGGVSGSIWALVRHHFG